MHQRHIKNPFIGLGRCLLLWLVLLAGLAVSYADKQAGPANAPAETVAKEPLESIVSLIEKGLWDRADALMKTQPSEAGEHLAPVKEVLLQYHALQQKRQEKQQQIYSEQSEKLQHLFERHAAGDPNATDQDVFAQAYTVWKDATDDQQAELVQQARFQLLLDQTYDKGVQFCQEGQWENAGKKCVKWLILFAPDHADYKALAEQLQQVAGVGAVLRKDYCDEKNRRYTTVTPETISKVFQILQAHYIEPVDFYAMAKVMVDRCVVLGDVMKTDSKDRLYHADPNNCAAWKDRLEQLSSDLKTQSAKQFDIRDFFGAQEVVLMINKQTLDLPQPVMLSLLTESALTELDSYTKVVWPSGVDDFDKMMNGHFGGVGFRIAKEGKVIKVVSLIGGTPAAKSGLRTDAQILAVDGEPTETMSVLCAVRKITGPIGTSVTLTIQYPDSDKQQLLTIVREKIMVPTVEGTHQADTEQTKEESWDYFLDEDEKIGYLRLSHFMEGTIKQVQSALQDLEAAALAGLILDLRGNGGGLLTTATGLSDLFIDDGVLLKSKGRGDKTTQWTATKSDVVRSYPLVILIDSASASASEIVAGVLGRQGYQRAVLVGTRSYGKGSVQEVMDLGSGQGKLKFTASHYYLPNGQPVRNRDAVKRQGHDDWGVQPDVTVPLYDFEGRQIRTISEKRRKGSDAKDGDSASAEETSIDEQMIDADPQLSTALLILKARMATGR